MRIQLLIIQGPLYIVKVFFFLLLLLSKFSSALSFDSFIIMYFTEDFIKFILLGVHWLFWMCRLMLFIKLGRFQPLFLQIFFLLLSFSPSGPPIMHIFICWYDWCCPTVVLDSFTSLFFIFFLLVPQTRLPQLNSYVRLYLLVSASSEFFISVIVLFNPRISIFFLFIISTFWLRFSISWDIVPTVWFFVCGFL